MSKYIDIKVTIWQRLHFEDAANMQQAIKKLEKGYLPAELCNVPELEFIECETLFDTEEFITPSENDGQSTIEVYEGENLRECIWDNSFESEIKRKNETSI
ncbi:MAG TPA: hypothetical protein PKD16_01340 [Saprospiraceae bacterium]|jgi:hypothetical protein|nr:hypothetical protein [Saprospiraceae bacterium]